MGAHTLYFDPRPKAKKEDLYDREREDHGKLMDNMKKILFEQGDGDFFSLFYHI